MAPGTYYLAGYLWSGGTATYSHLTQSITIQATAGTPTFSLTGPTSGTFTAGQSVTVQWTAGNVAAGSTINLCYDTDTAWNGNETWIEIGKVAAANGNGTYSWDTTGVAPGTYYIAGYLYSGGKATYSHLTQSITIQATTPTFTLTSPASGTFAAGVSVPIQWTAGNVGTGSTISLCYDTDTAWNGNENWIDVRPAAANGNGSYNWDTTGMAPGTYYIGGYLYSGGKPYYFHSNQPFSVVGAAVGFESHLIIPAAVTQSNSRTISVEYSNQGTTPITAPC